MSEKPLACSRLPTVHYTQCIVQCTSWTCTLCTCALTLVSKRWQAYIAGVLPISTNSHIVAVPCSTAEARVGSMESVWWTVHTRNKKYHPWIYAFFRSLRCCLVKLDQYSAGCKICSSPRHNPFYQPHKPTCISKVYLLTPAFFPWPDPRGSRGRLRK